MNVDAGDKKRERSDRYETEKIVNVDAGDKKGSTAAEVKLKKL